MNVRWHSARLSQREIPPSSRLARLPEPQAAWRREAARRAEEFQRVVALTVEVHLTNMTQADLPRVLALEQAAYAQPWQRQHFADCLNSGYTAQLLLGGEQLLGYFVVMKGFEEAHLLNLTVAPNYQRQGWAKLMLEALALWARAQQVSSLWLEVRAGNQRAIQVYEVSGYRFVGLRKNYYPASQGLREDALMMRLQLS